MIQQILFISSLSIFDSLSTTQQIIVFILLLTTEKPVRNSLFYLAGLSGSYFLFGLAGYAALDQLNIFLQKIIPSGSNVPDSVYYKSEVFTGVLFVVIGFIYYIKKKNSTKPPVNNIIIKWLKNMNPLFALAVGVFVSLTCFPFSLPYIAALGKFAWLKLSFPAASLCILFYNIGYALPMIIIFFIYLHARRGTDEIHDKLQIRAKRLNLKLTTWMFVGIGFLSIIDSLFFFITGHALLKGRYF